MTAAHQTDFYKTGHGPQYPDNTQSVYSNFTPRSSRLAPVLREYYDDKVVVFGIQAMCMDFLIKEFNEKFFKKSKQKAVKAYKRRMDTSLGGGVVSTDQVAALHDLGYLPLSIKAIPEGSRVNIKVPVLTVRETLPEFFWLVNYLETVMSCELWKPMTTATIAYEYRKILERYADETGAGREGIGIQCHDFSFRGMSGRHDAMMSGMGHLLSFVGTDTIPSIDAAEEFYFADCEKELIGCSVPACYDSETELLTEKGFVKFSELDEGVRVAQFHENGYISFTTPTEYYNMPYKGQMIKWSSKGVDNVDIMVTPNHKMVRWNMDKNCVQLFEAGDTSYKYRKGYSQRNHLLVSGITDSVENCDQLSALERLKVAFQADGSFPSGGNYVSGQIRFSLKKERKIIRLKDILDQTGFKYTISDKDERGYINFWVNPEGVCSFEKDFSWVNYERSCAWYRDFILELENWDGCRKNNTTVYSSTNKTCIDQVQSFAAICGYKTKISTYNDKREDCIREALYTLTLTLNSRTDGKPIVREFIDYDGRVYCVSVPTKMLVTRRNGKVAVCGNTEHSVICMGGKGNEIETFRRLIEDKYPTGIVSIVSDTWDFWKVITEYTVILKDKIMTRQPNELGLNKVVFRPDSGNPADIICGLSEKSYRRTRDGVAYPLEAWNGAAFIGGCDPIPEHVIKGAVECLWDVFGGTKTDAGYKVLDEHVGLIYGDSITLERADDILKRLKRKGFASSNIVFGVGSYTYQYITRDSFGFAMKATHGVVDSEPREIFKDPVTDSGTKKSAKGLLRVEKIDDDYVLFDQQTEEQEKQGELVEVFRDSKMVKTYTFSEIRDTLLNN